MSAPLLDGREALSFTRSPGSARDWGSWTAGDAQQYEAGLVEGRSRFAEVRRLAQKSPAAARQAIRSAITEPEWGRRVREGWGTEEGFAEAVAHAAVAYLCRQLTPRAFHSQAIRRMRP